MLEVLWSAGAFIVAVGFLVAFHEFGHFWVARRCGVGVQRFSIGFGPVLLRHKAADGVEYALSAIPLGGYVKMLDEREGEVPEQQLDRAFNRKPVQQRIAIVLAGPAANFLFAFVAYWAILVIGQQSIRPVIGPVADNSRAAQAQLHEGDEILQLDGQSLTVWDELRPMLLEAALNQRSLPVEVKRESGAIDTLQLDLRGVSVDPQAVFQQIGLNPPRPVYAPILGFIVEGEAAARVGLQSGDRIQALNDQSMQSWQQLRLWVRQHPGEIVSVDYLRDGQALRLEMAIGLHEEEGKTVGRFGAGVAAQPELWQDLQVDWRLGPLKAVPSAFGQMIDMSALTLKMLFRMVTGDVSVRNISGPLHIAEYAGVTAAVGFVAYLNFLAVISISLGVLNLLPIPVLDGGHLLYYLVEWVKGSPVPEKLQMMGQQLGMAALLMLMSVAFYNDIVRLVG
ncbi:MAG: RIP metalloprotease RseP [Oceanococcus sp.]